MGWGVSRTTTTTRTSTPYVHSSLARVKRIPFILAKLLTPQKINGKINIVKEVNTSKKIEFLHYYYRRKKENKKWKDMN